MSRIHPSAPSTVRSSISSRIAVAGALAPLLLSAAPAQIAIAIPAYAADIAGDAWTHMPGFTWPHRVQILIDPAHLAPAVGRSITALSVRRDTQFALPLSPGRVSLHLRMGRAAFAAVNTARDPAANSILATSVFQGVVDLLAAPPSQSASWDPPHAVAVPLQASYPYSGGGLCVDFEGAPLAGAVSSWWPVDAVTDRARGTTTVVGHTCGRYAPPDSLTHVLVGGRLVPGETVVFAHRAKPGGVSYMLVGFDLLPTPIDLRPLGAPGCELYLSGVTAIGTSPSFVELGSEVGALANVELELPSRTSLLGAVLTTQWVDLDAPIATSNALLCRLSGVETLLGLATVTVWPGAALGDVSVTAAPVLRFALQ